MNKFGLIDDVPEEASDSPQTLVDKLSSFPSVRPRAPIDLKAVDAAALPHGFISREATPATQDEKPHPRRRRAYPPEPTRHLAIRLVSSQYDRFVAYADRHRITYHEALLRLLDTAGE
jgi:hypothetical protein